MPVRAALILAVLLVCALHARDARAGEAELDDAPPPAEVRDELGPLRAVWEERKRAGPRFFLLSKLLSNLPPFFSDARAGAHFRTAAFDQTRVDDSRSAAWAMGGWLEAETGEICDMLSAEFKYYLSAPVIATRSRDGTLLLEPGQRTIDVLGVANARLRWGEHTLTGGRFETAAPYLNGSDNRMVPNTFEGVRVLGEWGDLRYGAGYTWNIKRRDSDEFISMAEAAGATGSGGLATLGGYWDVSENFYVGVVNHLAADVYNTLYAETAFTLPLARGADARLELQFTDQRSLGRAKAGDFEAQSVGARLSASAFGLIGKVGFSVTADGARVRNAWGSSPSHVNLMQRTFTRANERAVLGSLSWNGEPVGLPGLSAIVNVAHGWGARAQGSVSLPVSTEVDVTVDMRITEGAFGGLWLRLRGSWLGEDHSRDDGADFRLILNYDLPLL